MLVRLKDHRKSPEIWIQFKSNYFSTHEYM